MCLQCFQQVMAEIIYSAVERGGQGGKLPRAPRQKGGPAIPKKKFVRQFFNPDCQCKCFMLTRFSRTIAKKNCNENIILLNGFWR